MASWGWSLTGAFAGWEKWVPTHSSRMNHADEVRLTRCPDTGSPAWIEGNPKVDSPQLWTSCHKWKERRITWDENWFLWVRENEFSDICWPLLMECVTGWMEWEKERRQTTNVIEGKDKRHLMRNTSSQPTLLTLQSLPTAFGFGNKGGPVWGQIRLSFKGKEKPDCTF